MQGPEGHVLEDILGVARDIDELIDYQKDAVVSKMLLTKATGNVTLFAFDGEGLSEHSAPFDALVVGLDGEGIVQIDGNPNTISRGMAIVMPANTPHAVIVDPGKQFKMLLVMIKS